MPDQATIERIAKILARGTSDNAAEAATAISAAYKRMVRDDVTLTDLLTLDDKLLYQGPLNRLAELIATSQTSLGRDSQRELLAEYIEMICRRFESPGQRRARAQREAGAGQGRSQQDEARKRQEEDAAQKTRQQHQEEYQRRTREAEANRQREQAQPGTRQQTHQESANNFSRQNGNTANDESKGKAFVIAPFPFSFSPATFFSGIFGNRSLIHCFFAHPFRAGGLFFISLGISVAVSVVIISLLGSMGPESSIFVGVIYSIFTAKLLGFPILVFVIGIVFAYVRYTNGWFETRPIPGVHDGPLVAKSAVLFVCYLAWYAGAFSFAAFKYIEARSKSGAKSKASS